MKEFIPILKKTRLFQGVSENDIAAMLSCLQAKMRTYKKGEYVLNRGDKLTDIFVLTRGRVHIQYDDYWGNRSIIGTVGVGETFGEAYAAPESGALMCDLLAVEDSAVMLLDVKRVITVCSSACKFHSMVVQNLFYSTCEKNRALMQKITCITRRTTRDKLLAYLTYEERRQGGDSFTIPYNRQQLADYLSINRCAMSGELSKMREEGIIEFEKSRFRFCRPSSHLQ